MLRLKRLDGGEVNIHIEKIVAFANTEEGTQVVLENGLTYVVENSCQSIRNALKKLGFEFN